MKSKPFRSALIGCGAIAQLHLANLAAGDYTDIVALCDIREERALAYREQYAKGAAIYTDYRKMLDEVKPDAVHITTPHDLHAEMACECLRRGIHVYLEKPVCISEEELLAVEAAAAASDARITVSFQNRRTPQNILFYRLLREEGGAVAARGQLSWDRGKKYYTADDWHGILKREGGGVMINQAIHTLDLLISAFDEQPTAVSGQTFLFKNAPFSEVEDNAFFLVDFEGGGRLSFSATLNYPTDAPVYYEVFTRSGAYITGMNGHLYKNGIQVDTEENLVPIVGKSCWGTGHTVSMKEFYTAIREGGEVPVPLASAARTMRVLFALYRANGGRALIKSV